MRILLQYIFIDNNDVIRRCKEAKQVSKKLFEKLEKLFKDCFLIAWGYEYLKYNGVKTEEKDAILKDLANNVYGMFDYHSLEIRKRNNMNYIDKVYHEMIREDNKLDWRGIKRVEDCFWAIKANNGIINSTLNMGSFSTSTRTLPFIYDESEIDGNKCIKYLEVGCPCNEVGEYLLEQVKERFDQAIDIPVGDELVDLYEKVLTKEFKKANKEIDTWWGKTDVKIPKKEFNKSHIFAFIQTVVMNTGLNH